MVRSLVPVRIGLVGDIKSQRPVPTAARDLYVSNLFDARRAYVERTCDAWYILSANHGLLHPEQRVAPYERRVSDMDAKARATWTRRVLWQLDQVFYAWRETEVELHAGTDFRGFGLVEGLIDRGARVSVPTEGLHAGAQLSWYASGGVVDLTDGAPAAEPPPVDVRPPAHWQPRPP
jgi:hypothetical protein